MTRTADTVYTYAHAFHRQVLRELQEIGYTLAEAEQMIVDKGLRGAGEFVETERDYAQTKTKVADATLGHKSRCCTSETPAHAQETQAMLVVDTTTGNQEFREVATKERVAEVTQDLINDGFTEAEAKEIVKEAGVKPAAQIPYHERSAERIEADNDLATYNQLLTVPVVAVTEAGYKVVRHLDALEAALHFGSKNPRFKFNIWVLNGKSATLFSITYREWHAMTDTTPDPAQAPAPAPAPSASEADEADVANATPGHKSRCVAFATSAEDLAALENLSLLKTKAALLSEVNRLRAKLRPELPKLGSKLTKGEVQVEAYNLCHSFDVAYVFPMAEADKKAEARKAPTKAELENFCNRANGCFVELTGINWRSSKQRLLFAEKVGYYKS